MKKENVLLSSKIVEISEHKTYLELLNRVCFYDYPNYNGAELPSDGAFEKAQTLVDMPVKAKYTVNSNGLPTFRGHEAYIDSDGDLAFDTEKIGTHTEVYIANDVVEMENKTLTLPCLFARQKIWTDNKNVVAAVKRLYSEGRLHNSWELIADEYQYSNGIKKITDYVFTSNVYLGYEYADPAYGKSAKVISLSNKDNHSCGYELLIAESLSRDLLENQNDNSDINFAEKEDKILPDIKENEVLDEQTIADTEVVEETVSTEDIDSNSEATETETETEVEEDTNEDVVSQLTLTVESLKSDLSERDDTIIQLNTKIQDLTAEVAGLVPFKEKFEQVEQERIAQETATKKEALKQKILQSKVITQEEIETSEDIKNLIENLDENGVNRIVVDRLISSASKETKSNKKTEVAQKETPVVQTDIVDTDIEVSEKEKITPREFINSYIRGK